VQNVKKEIRQVVNLKKVDNPVILKKHQTLPNSKYHHPDHHPDAAMP
jgi:hypothetical protein